MTASIKSSFPLGDMPARVLTGKVLMKAGADRETIRSLRALIGELEMDQRAFELTTAFPTMLWTGSKELQDIVGARDDDPERPVILFSVLDRVASDAEIRQVTHTWREQQLSAGAPTQLLGSINESTPAPARWLATLRAGRSHYSRLEKICMAAVVIQFLIGMLWLGLKPGPFRRQKVTAKAQNMVSHSAGPRSALPAMGHPVKPRHAPARIPIVKIEEFIFYSGGRVSVHWGSAGERYRYRVYVSKDAEFKTADAASIATWDSDFTWIKKASADWLAVRVVDPSGREGPLSEAIYVGL